LKIIYSQRNSFWKKFTKDVFESRTRKKSEKRVKTFVHNELKEFSFVKLVDNLSIQQYIWLESEKKKFLRNGNFLTKKIQEKFSEFL